MYFTLKLYDIIWNHTDNNDSFTFFKNHIYIVIPSVNVYKPQPNTLPVLRNLATTQIIGQATVPSFRLQCQVYLCAAPIAS